MRAALSRRVMLPLFWKLKGLPVACARDELARGDPALAGWRHAEVFNEKRLAQQLAYALATVPAYRGLAATVNDDDIQADPGAVLRRFPVVTKSDYRDRIDRFRSDAVTTYVENFSGGSTGLPVRVLQDPRYKAAALAAIEHSYAMAGIAPGSRLVKLWGAERDLLAGGYGMKQRISDFINNTVTINAFTLSPERMREFVATINRVRPVCVEGYADAMFSFARFIREHNLEIHSPEHIVTSAGTLYPEMRSMISAVFEAPVRDRYGCREVGVIAMQRTDGDGRMHCVDAFNRVEVVDDTGEPVGQGEEGRVLVTNLVNRAMPIIRYEIGDTAIVGHAGTCTTLERVTGRTTHSLRTRAGGYVSPTFFAHFIGVMLKSPEILEFQVVQKSLDVLEIRLKTRDGFDADRWAADRAVDATVRRVMGDNCRVDIVKVADFERTTTGKHHMVISELD